MNNKTHRMTGGLYPHIRITWKEFISMPEKEQKEYLYWMRECLRANTHEIAHSFKVSLPVLEHFCAEKGITFVNVSSQRTRADVKRVQNFLKGYDKTSINVKQRMRRYDKVRELKAQGMSDSSIALILTCSMSFVSATNSIWKAAEKGDIARLRYYATTNHTGMVRWACIRHNIDIKLISEELDPETIAQMTEATATTPATPADTVVTAAEVLEAAEKAETKVTSIEFKRVLQEFNGHMRFLRALLVKPA